MEEQSPLQPPQKSDDQKEKEAKHEVALREYLSQLEGAVVTGTDVKNVGGELWPLIQVGWHPDQRAVIAGSEGHRTITIGGDEEGNTPGMVLGLPDSPSGMVTD
jgi:hypothetical protein